MEKNLLIQKLNNLLTTSILNVTRFGRSDTPLLWIATPSLQDTSARLKEDPELKLDWLENLSVVEFDGVFVVSYFLRSTTTSTTLILRVSEVPSKPNVIMKIPSVQSVWPMAAPFEEEIAVMFGIQFNSEPFISQEFNGYPLRKGYQFPEEIHGIQHQRSPSEEGTLV